jgi:hypothetical protein
MLKANEPIFVYVNTHIININTSSFAVFLLYLNVTVIYVSTPVL